MTLYRGAPLDDPNQDHRDRDHEEDVDEPPEGVGGDHPEEPQHDEENQDRRQQLSGSPNVIGQTSRHGWGSLLPTRLFCRICYFYS